MSLASADSARSPSEPPTDEEASIQSLRRELDALVVTSGVEPYIRQVLAQVATDDDLVRFFSRFTQYNQPFPGGVASLTGAFHVRSDLFRDEADPIHANTDRSSLIASNIMYAAEDEFAGADRSVRITHRMMAQEVLRLAATHADWAPEQVNEVRDARHSARIHAALIAGYRLNRVVSDLELFRALGFHLGSERLADIEFSELDAMLRSTFPAFVELASRELGSLGFPLYEWIATHTTVEEHHFLYGVRAAVQAMDWYVGPEETDDLRAAIRSGFMEFMAFQHLMFDNLIGDNQ